MAKSDNKIIIITIFIIGIIIFIKFFGMISFRIFGEGGDIGQRTYLNILYEDNEKITLEFKATANVRDRADCSIEEIDTIDSEWQESWHGGDYEKPTNLRNAGELILRDYYSLESEAHYVDFQGVSATADICSGNSHPYDKNKIVVYDKKAVCRIIHKYTGVLDKVECRFTAKATNTENLPIHYYANPLEMTAEVTFYKAGYEPTLTYYKFENNACSSISLKPSQKTSNDYDTLSECQSRIRACSSGVDANSDGTVSRAELASTITGWIFGSATRAELGQAIMDWSVGC